MAIFKEVGKGNVEVALSLVGYDKELRHRNDSHTDSILGLTWNKEYRFKPLHGIIIFQRFCLVNPLITRWLWIPSHTDEFQPMLEVWHEIHTMSTQLS